MTNLKLEFMKEITFFLSSETSHLVMWDALNADLRGHITSYTAQIKGNKECLGLSHQICEVDKQYDYIKIR